MNPREAGFLLLSSKLGNPDRKVLTIAQLRTLGERAKVMPRPIEDRDIEVGDLLSLGYGPEMARRILALLDETDVLEHYLRRGSKMGCVPISRVSEVYPARLKQTLGLEATGCLWAKGDLSLLERPMIALVGSRDLHYENKRFAAEAGRQAALQGYTLVSGNARGADRTAQNACLRAGGSVISIVADELAKQPLLERVLYLSEDGFDEGFSAQRALSRNRCIHAIGDKVLVAQSSFRQGGTWHGTANNLHHGWSEVYCFDDGSDAVQQLFQMGAEPLQLEELMDLKALQASEQNMFDR